MSWGKTLLTKLNDLYRWIEQDDAPAVVKDDTMPGPTYRDLSLWLISLSDPDCNACRGFGIYWKNGGEPCPRCISWNEKNPDSSLCLLIDFVKHMSERNRQIYPADEILRSFRQWLRENHKN